MPETDVFERRLEAALRDYADQRVLPVDPVAYATRIADEARPARALAPAVLARLSWLLVFAALLALLLASAVLVGTQPDEPLDSGWRPMTFPEANAVADIVETPTGYLAVGAADHTAEGLNAAVWSSDDCSSWQRLRGQADLESPGWHCVRTASSSRCGDGSQAEAVESSAGRFIAVGWGEVWASTDGHDWERVATRVLPAGTDVPSTTPSPETIETPATENPMDVHDVAAIGDRLVAVGGDAATFGIWSSRDGATWERATFTPPLVTDRHAPGVNGWAPVRGIAATGAALLAAGVDGHGVGVWRSTDGLHWERILGADETTGGNLADLAVAPDGTIVAIGTAPTLDGASRPVVWRSADGEEWSRSSDLPGFAPSPPSHEVTLTAVEWAENGFVIVGHGLSSGSRDTASEHGPGPAPRGLVWTSPDGLEWTLEPPDPALAGASPDRLMRCADRLIVSGWAEGLDSASAWSRRLDPFEMEGTP